MVPNTGDPLGWHRQQSTEAHRSWYPPGYKKPQGPHGPWYLPCWKGTEAFTQRLPETIPTA